jgi:hypothetical protein
MRGKSSTIPQIVAPFKLCECGCGQPTFIAPKTYARLGTKKGQPHRFLPDHQARIPEDVRIAQFWARVDKSGECWLWTGSTMGGGYGQFRWNARGTATHRVSYELAHGPIPAGMEVCHNCPGGDNPLCVNPAHLFLGSHADNMHDMAAKGKKDRGEKHYSTTLTDKDVRLIRTREAAGETQRALAAAYGLTFQAIHRIVRRKTWRHVA